MIGAREKELGRTRSQTKELMSPRNESMERAELTMEDWIHETCLISAVTSGPTEPKTFQEAWHSPVEEERNNWQAAIRKEIKSMINIGVWRKIDKVKIPENRRLIGNKWVFKIKRDGTYRARLVALGYSQIPGIDYTDNFAPVAHDVSFRIALARMMVEKLDSLVMDVENAFLYGDIKEEIFMKSPVGMEEIDSGSSPEDCYQLKKGIYGLCQAARQFWKKFVETIKKEERLERRWNPKTREDKVEVYTKFLNYKLENTRQRPMDWIAFMEKKRAELMNTGHIMSDETFITHLLNSLPQTVYEGAILVIKDKLRRSILEITEIEQIL